MTTLCTDPLRDAAEAGESAPVRVIHSAMKWLPQTQTWMFNQARALPDHIENHVVCETTANLDVFPMANLHSLADGSKLRFAWDKLMRGMRLRHHLGHLPRVAKAIGADVLHSHFGHIGWTNVAAARRADIAHVVTYYGQDLTYLPRLDPRWFTRYQEMFAAIDLVLCEGPHMAKKVIELGCPADRVKVHHLGVDVASFRFEPRTWQPGEPLRVLMAGSFTEKKGLPDGLRALGRVRDEIDLKITVVGDANAEPRNQAEKRAILSVVAEYGLEDHVEFRGYQPHSVLMDAAFDHHIFLSPSVHAADGDTEGGAPVTIIEMAATGMPVVSTAHCDIGSVVRDGETGLLANEHDVDGLADHLRTLVAHPERWEEMGTAARRHVEAEYDMRRQGEALARIYRFVAR